MPQLPIDFAFSLNTLVFPDTTLSLNALKNAQHRQHFACLHCHTPNMFDVDYYRGGYPLETVYKDHTYITREELLYNKAAQKAYRGEERLGELTLWHVEARYLAQKCSDCNAWYILIYGTGEIQPGREELQISGIWKITRRDVLATDV